MSHMRGTPALGTQLSSTGVEERREQSEPSREARGGGGGGGDKRSCMHLSVLDTVHSWESRDSRWRNVLLLLLCMLAIGLLQHICYDVQHPVPNFDLTLTL